jgi:hypothetical protein
MARSIKIRCSCGAIYERTEEKLTFRDIDSYKCRVCGETLESWSGSRIPVFRLISTPDEKSVDS